MPLRPLSLKVWSVSTGEIFISLKRNGFDISLLEIQKILARLVKEGYIDREISSALE